MALFNFFSDRIFCVTESRSYWNLLINVLSLHVLLIHVLSLHVLLNHVLSLHVLLNHVLSLRVLLNHILSLHVLLNHVLLIQSMFYQSSPVHVLSHAKKMLCHLGPVVI